MAVIANIEQYINNAIKRGLYECIFRSKASINVIKIVKSKLELNGYKVIITDEYSESKEIIVSW